MEFLLGLLDQTNKGIVSFHEDGRLSFASLSFTEITGYSAKEIESVDVWRKLLFPDPIYRDFLSSRWDEKERELKSQRSFKAPTIETRMLTKAGSFKYINLTRIHYRETINYLLEDVTEQKKIEEKLIESENKLRLFVENSPAALAMLDKELRYLIVSKRWYADYHLTADDVIGKKHYEIFPDIPERWKQIHARCLTGVVEKAEEDFFLRENGEVVWLKWEIQPWYLSNGAVGGLIFLTEVITKQKLANLELETSEANFRAILETTDTAYLLLDTELKVKSFNHLAGIYSVALFNHQAKIGDSLPDSVTPERRAVIKEKLSEVLKGKPVEYVSQVQGPDGKDIWIFNRFLPIKKSTDGAILGVMIATRDVTSQKSEEIQRDRLISDLIQHNKELEQFAYIVSHNLRAPVTNIISIIDALSDLTLSDSDKTQFQSYLLLSAKKLDEIIGDLNFILKSRKEHTEQRETIDLNEIVNQILSSLDTDIIKSKIRFEMDFSKAPVIQAIKGNLYLILNNLISNAIKFRDLTREPIVKLSSWIDKNYLILNISDNGLGVDVEKYGDEIFGLYKRFHPATEGKGLGLYLVKSMLEAMGGRINLRSKANQGTEITLRFPLNTETYSA